MNAFFIALLGILGAALGSFVAILGNNRLEFRKAEGRVLAAASGCRQELKEISRIYRNAEREPWTTQLHMNMLPHHLARLLGRAEALHDAAATDNELWIKWGWFLESLREQVLEADPAIGQHAAVADTFANAIELQMGRQQPEEPALITRQRAKLQELQTKMHEAEALTARQRALDARRSPDATDAEIRRCIESDVGPLVELWQENLGSLDNDDLAPHLRGIAKAVQWVAPRHFDSFLNYALRIASMATDKDRLLDVLMEGWQAPVLVSALARRPPFSEDERLIDASLKYVNKASEGLYAITNSPNLAEPLLLWAENDPAAARAWVLRAIQDQSASIQLLSNLATHDSELYDGYRLDVVFKTVGTQKLDLAFAKLASTHYDLAAERKAFKHALAQYEKREEERRGSPR